MKVFATVMMVGVLWTLAAQQASAPIPPGTTLKVELQQKVDSKKAKVGDKVVAKLSQDLKINGNEVAAKNSLLTGEVTTVTPSDHGQPAKLGILFNRLVPKKGAPLAVRAAVVKVYQEETTAMEIPPEMGGGNSAMTFNAGNPAYANMDRASDGIPIRYGVMETATGSGPDLGGVIESVGNNFSLDDGAHLQVRFLHN